MENALQTVKMEDDFKHLQTGSDIFAYLHQLTQSYDLEDLHFFDLTQSDCDIHHLAASIGCPSNDEVSDTANTSTSEKFNFSLLQEIKSDSTPQKWCVIDCEKIRPSEQQQSILIWFQELQHDYDIYLPFNEPTKGKYLIGFGENQVPYQSIKGTMRHSTTAIYYLEKIIRIMQATNRIKFKITTRELECISWVAKGKTSNEIGTILSISEKTVDGHVASVCRKLDSVNRIQMIATAVRLKLI